MHIGIIGFGNMGQALAEGLRLGHPKESLSLHASAQNQQRLRAACERLGAQAASNQELAKTCDLLILAVKPWQIEMVVREIAPLMADKMVISVAAGFSFARLSALLPKSARALCCIPNTPIAAGQGILCCEQKHSFTEEDVDVFHQLFDLIALTVFLEEKQLSAASAIAGCGPAFAALFLEALGDGGVKHGVPRQTAYLLAARMLAGTAALYQQTGQHPGQIKDNVCSPGGTTIRGIAALEENGFRHAVISAIDAVENV